MQDTRGTSVSRTCSVIDRLLEELVDEVAMGAVNLNPIKASLDGISGSHTVQLNNPWDLRGVHRPGGWQILEGALFLAIWTEDGVVLTRNGLVCAGWHGLASWLVVCKTVSVFDILHVQDERNSYGVGMHRWISLYTELCGARQTFNDSS